MMGDLIEARDDNADLMRKIDKILRKNARGESEARSEYETCTHFEPKGLRQKRSL